MFSSVKSKLVASLLAGALLVGALSGCGGTEKPQSESNTSSGQAAKTTITTAGSTSVQPLSEELAKAFQAKKPNITVNVQGGGSSQGIKAAAEGIAEIGACSRELKESEKSLGLVENTIALDGIAVVVNPQNSQVSDLTIEQVKKIFAGEIKNWKDVGGKDAPINVVTREAGSGTRGAFEELVMGKEAKITDNAVTSPSNGAVRTSVAGDPNAIGYISIGYLNEEVKPVKIDGVEPKEDNVKSGQYKISRPFIYLTKGEPQGAAKEFIEFVLSPEGQKIVAKHYIPVK
ncbi:phosphate ABC transporter substrate-binding protein [Desulfurispora thermophila]|uniref:phosphate ABC transporter substrate-binding protein n=1 Tax=Desulfurispora thermophila TaxID=265470 RepID=UPI0003612994|nr:phosphate ABC transporter substrate-binding protein [Desulfurispora thermophila]